MKFSTAVAVAAFAAVGSAQLDNIPSCALACFLGPLGSDGCAQLTDFECHCQKAESLFAAVIPCVQGACETPDQEATIAAVKQTCSDAGVEVDVPITPGEESSAAPEPTPTATVTPDASGSTPPAESTPAPSSAAESSAVEVSTSVSAAPTPSGNGTTSATPTPSEFVGAGSKMAVGAGAIALAMLAL